MPAAWTYVFDDPKETNKTRMLLALNVQELVAILSATKSAPPPPLVQGPYSMAAAHVDAGRWSLVVQRAGLSPT